MGWGNGEGWYNNNKGTGKGMGQLRFNASGDGQMGGIVNQTMNAIIRAYPMGTSSVKHQLQTSGVEANAGLLSTIADPYNAMDWVDATSFIHHTPYLARSCGRFIGHSL